MLAPAPPCFCGLKSITRPAGEHATDAALEGLLPSSRCLLFQNKQIACVDTPAAAATTLDQSTSAGTPATLRLLTKPMSEIVSVIDPETVALLGVAAADDHSGLFVAMITSAAAAATPPPAPLAGITWTEVVPAAAKLSREDAALAGYAKSRLRLHVGQRFCAACGTLTERRGAGSKRFCANCKAEVFTRTDPVAIVLVVHPTDPHKILLVRKAVYQPRTRYTCVAGFIEPGESAEEGACREVLEETGVALDCNSIRFLASQPWPSDIGGQLMIGFQARAVSSDAITLDRTELDDGKWFTSDAVRNALAGTPSSELTVPGPHALACFMLRKWLASL